MVLFTVFPLCGAMVSTFLFPDLTEAIQAENVFCSLCITVTTGIKVSLLLALAVIHPSALPLAFFAALVRGGQPPRPAHSPYQTPFLSLVSIGVLIRWRKTLVESNY